MIDSFRPLIEVRYVKVLSSSLSATLSVTEDEAAGSVDFTASVEAPTVEAAGALELAPFEAVTGAPKENPENGLGLFVDGTGAGAAASLAVAGGAVTLVEPTLVLEPAEGVVAAAGAPKEKAANGDFAGAG
jgi:hypothetical protein